MALGERAVARGRQALKRLEDVVRASKDRRAHEIVQAITEAVDEYSAEVGGPEDDLTVSIVKVK